MTDSILKDKYKLIWKEANDKVFVAELRFFSINKFGGSIETPIGIVVGFIEDRPKFWRVKIIIRNDIKYNQTKNKIFVFIKSAYKRKINYYIDKIVDMLMPNYRIDNKLKDEIRRHLIEYKICQEQMSITVSEESIKSFEFIGEVTLDDME